MVPLHMLPQIAARMAMAVLEPWSYISATHCGYLPRGFHKIVALLALQECGGNVQCKYNPHAWCEPRRLVIAPKLEASGRGWVLSRQQWW